MTEPNYVGWYRSSDQKWYWGVCAGIAHKLVNEKLTFLPLSLRPVVQLLLRLIIRYAFAILGALIVGFFLYQWMVKRWYAYPTSSNPDWSNVELPDPSLANNWDELGSLGKIFCKWLASNVPAGHTTAWGQETGTKDMSNSPTMQKLAEIANKGAQELKERGAPSRATNDTGTPSYSETKNNNPTSGTSSTSPVSASNSMDNSVFPTPYATSGAVISQFNPNTGEYKYEQCCNACRTTFGYGHGSTMKGTYKPPSGGIFICPKCSHRSDIKIGWG